MNPLGKNMGGWLSGRALPSHGRGHRFESCSAHEDFFDTLFADVAQLVEQLIRNQQVVSSILTIGLRVSYEGDKDGRKETLWCL